MNMNCRVISVSIFAVTLLSTVMLQEPARGGQIADASPTLASSGGTFEGLLAVKEADGVFLVRAEDGKKKRFTIHKKTVITRNGKPAGYRDLQSRDRVRVHYDSDFAVTEIHAEGN